MSNISLTYHPMKNILAFTLFITLALSACKKDLSTEPVDPNQLPPATEIGANILACKVNGKAHIYTSTSSLFSENGVYLSRIKNGQETRLLIGATENKYEDHIQIEIYEPEWKIVLNKEYRLSNEKKDDASYFLRNIPKEYKTTINSGHIIFSQYNDNVVAGKFSFTLYNDSNDSVVITEGFFDIAPAK